MNVVAETFRPYKRLAVRVIALALQDAANPVGSPTHAESARTFLAGSPMLRLWCEIAHLDPHSIAVGATALVRPPAARIKDHAKPCST